MNRILPFALLAMLMATSPASAGIASLIGVWKDTRTGAIIVASRQGGRIKLVPGKGGDFTMGRAELLSENANQIRFLATFEKGGRVAPAPRGVVPTPPATRRSGTLNTRTQTITWEGGGSWQRHVDPNLAKMQNARITAEVKAARQRAEMLEQMLAKNAKVNADALAALQAELTQLMNAQQASEAEREQLAETLERLRATGEEKKIAIPDEPVSFFPSTYTAPAASPGGTPYAVSEYWASRWNEGGNWILGGRRDQRVSLIEISSSDRGATLTGSFAYVGEGPIDFRATRTSGTDYKVQVRWGGALGEWRDEPAWKIGGRPNQPLVALKARSDDGGGTLAGDMTYNGEGPIGFKGTAK
jgi:hypothetical protein